MCADVSEVLSGVVEDVGRAVHRNVSGAQLLQELLNAPWLHALLKVRPTQQAYYSKTSSHDIISCFVFPDS